MTNERLIVVSNVGWSLPKQPMSFAARKMIYLVNNEMAAYGVQTRSELQNAHWMYSIP